MTSLTDREAWLADRRLGLGGSDEASVFNEDWGCRLALWFEKRSTPPDYPAEYTALMERGTELEDPAARVYERKTGRTIEKRPAVVSATHPWLRVNIDREIAPVPEHDGPGVLEIKTAGYQEFRRIRREGLRNAYVLQLQHGLAATGYSWGAFAVLWPDGWQLVHFDVERDETLIRAILREGESFWRTVEHGPMPDALLEIDKRCRACPWRKQCRGEALLAAARETMGADDGSIEQDEAIAPLLVDYREAKRMFDDAEGALDAIKEAIRAHLAERTAAACTEGKVYYRTQVAQRVDAKGLRAKYPEVYADVLQPSPSRPLRVYTT